MSEKRLWLAFKNSAVKHVRPWSESKKNHRGQRTGEKFPPTPHQAPESRPSFPSVLPYLWKFTHTTIIFLWERSKNRKSWHSYKTTLHGGVEGDGASRPDLQLGSSGVSASPQVGTISARLPVLFQFACPEDRSRESRNGDIFFWYVLWEGVSFLVISGLYPCCCWSEKKRKKKKGQRKGEKAIKFS